MAVEEPLSVIPAKYRVSHIMRTMQNYAKNGTTWERCIEEFERDSSGEQYKVVGIANDIIAMNKALSRIGRNSKLTAFYAGVIAWNTR